MSTDGQKKYSVAEFSYSYYDRVAGKDRSVKEYNVEFDSLSDFENKLECLLGQIFHLEIKVRD